MPFNLHFVTDLLSAAAGSCAGWWLYRRYLMPAGVAGGPIRRLAYWMVLVISAALGAYWLGTINLIVSGQPGIGRSVFGAVLGAIVGIELYKLIRGQRGSTGAVFVLPLALGLGLGRVGCFLAGIDDFTFGSPTDLPWAHDFGDGIPRHPVQLYESAVMLAFAGVFFAWAKMRPAHAAAYGFHIFMLVFAADRFALEYLKPYGRIVNDFTVFQIGAVLLFLYAACMLWGNMRHHARNQTLSLLRPDDLAVRDLPAPGPGQDPHRG